MTRRTLEELVENFSLFDDWEGRYNYLIDLGSSLPPMDDALKNDQTKVNGCVSQVWLYHTRGADGRYHFTADSDGKITKGLVYIVVTIYEGMNAQEIRAVDIEAEFARLGLDENLSPNRRNGFFAMVERIRGLSA